MMVQIFQPGPPLDHFIENFWLYDDYVPNHQNERILPSGTIELVINLRDDELRIGDPTQPAKTPRRYSGALVSGTYGGSFLIDTQQERSLLGIHFKPGGAFPFLGISADALTDTHVNMETLWGRSALLLREQLCETQNPEERFRIAENALKRHLFRPLEHHYAVLSGLDALMASERPGLTGHEEDCIRVRDIARNIGVSERRFIQVFRSEVGLTPRRFYRIQRFQRALALLQRTIAAPDFASIAAECTYFDQSHLIHDFVAFSGFTPMAYVRQEQRLRQMHTHIKRNHLPLTESPDTGQFFPIPREHGAI